MRHRLPQSGMFPPSIFFLILVIAVVSFVVASNNKPRPVHPLPQTAAVPASVRAHVIKVYDGDTIKLDNGEKVRLIGIDTPELHNNPKLFQDVKKTGLDAETIRGMGARSYEFTQGLLTNRDIRLEFDAQPRDRYGRLLAYVYLEDGTFVNEEIIRNGYAYPMAIRPNTRHAVAFKALYEEARVGRRGLWK